MGYWCTRTYVPEENESIVQALSARVGEVAVVETVALPCPGRMPGLAAWRGRALHPDLVRAVRILPDGVQDAFFLCRIRKR